jgi:acyl dehydratase
MLFEDFEVGQRFTSPTRVVSDVDLAQFTALSGDDHPLHVEGPLATAGRFGRPILQGSFGAAVAAGLWSTLGLVTDSVVAALGDNWTYHRPIVVGDELNLHVLVTRLAWRGTENGELTRYNELRRADGKLVQSGSSTTLLAAAGRARSTNRDVGTEAWGRSLAEELAGIDAFESAVASWDGTIGIRGDEHEIHLRLYRGRIIDVTTRAPHGPTFTVAASDRVWAEVLTAADSRFGTRLMSGDFRASGDPYEYLRLTKAVEIIVETARELSARPVRSAGDSHVNA